MKRIFFILITLVVSAVYCSAAMSNSRLRKESRFLTDKMAYELNLSTGQYNDVYEINYDFIDQVRDIMDEVLDGYEWALNDYYRYLDYRNDDLRWVLTAAQYHKFMDREYFFRPLFITNNTWTFRVHLVYVNHNHFYFPKPYHYKSYCGGHSHHYYHNVSFYHGRYDHPCYTGTVSVRNNRTTRRSDFGSVRIKPNTTRQPSRTSSSTRRTSSTLDDVYATPSRTSSGNSTRTSSGTRTGSSTRTSSSTRSSSSTSNSRTSGTTRSSSSTTRSNSGRSTRTQSTQNNSTRSSSSVRSSSGSSTRSSSTAGGSSRTSSSSRSSSSSSRR